MSRPQGVAEAFARLCPDIYNEDKPFDAPDAGYVALNDLVTTGLEGGYSWFVVESYHPDRDGSVEQPWAVVHEGCPRADRERPNYDLNRDTVRTGLERWIDFRLDRGDGIHSILHNLEDMDLNDADAVLQFATWGELRYG